MTFSLLAAPATAAVLALGAAPGSTGVGIGAAPLCLPALARPGASYPLGTAGIQDTGTAAETITARVEAPFNGLPGTPVPPSWVSISYPRTLWVIPGSSVSLAPGGSAYLPVTLHVPASARPGQYAADLVAAAAPSTSSGAGGTAVLGAAAETNLEFTVAGPGQAAPSCDPATGPASTRTPVPDQEAAAATGPASPSPVPADAVLAALAAGTLALAWRNRRRGQRRRSR
jgi:hypothetical protein